MLAECIPCCTTCLKMPHSILFVLFLLLWQEEVPYKPAEDFRLGLDYNFKTRPTEQVSDYDREKKVTTGGPLPYLILDCKILKLADGEVKVKIVRGSREVISTRNIKVGTSINLDMGFTEDMKDRVTPHEYTLYFLNDKKKQLSRIHLFIGEEGDFLVNGTTRGKF